MLETRRADVELLQPAIGRGGRHGLGGRRAQADWRRPAVSAWRCRARTVASCSPSRFRSSDRRPRPASIAERGLRAADRPAADFHCSALERLVARDGARQARSSLSPRAPRRRRFRRRRTSRSIARRRRFDPARMRSAGARARGRARRIEIRQFAADHGANKPAGRRLGERRRHDRSPVLQHGHPIRDRLDFGHPVGDVDDRHAFGAQSLHEIKQASRVDAIERGGRLVHDENARVDRERFCDLDDLLLRDRKVARRRLRRDGGAEPAEQPARLVAHPPPVDKCRSEPARCRERRSPRPSDRARRLNS